MNTSNDTSVPDARIFALAELPGVLNRPEFASVSDILFDLDNTLHDFKGAAGAAIDAVYDSIIAEYGFDREALSGEYAKILARAEKDSFREGKTSYQYRTERFASLLGRFSVSDETFIADLVREYGESFEKNLKPDKAVQETLRQLSGVYGLCLITEGPLDAQIRTVSRLGIGGFFQRIFTSGEYGKIKETGDLFRVALDALHLSPGKAVVVGDSVSKDIRGAKRAGIKSIQIETARHG